MSRHLSLKVSRVYYQIGIMTLITSIFWVGLEIYQATSKIAGGVVDKAILEPVTPRIDEETLEKITTRSKVEGVITIEEILPEIAEELSASPSASESGTIEIVEDIE